MVAKSTDRAPTDEVATSDDAETVEISAVGSKQIVSPTRSLWREWFENGPRASEDFMSDREQPEDEQRSTPRS